MCCHAAVTARRLFPLIQVAMCEGNSNRVSSANIGQKKKTCCLADMDENYPGS